MNAAYYNEIDPFAAAWLRELIKANHIAPGEVDQRSIEDVEPNDLRGFAQCHFFAGIGGWSYALRLAGWPDDRAVWTGSCPCQPFSAAGKRKGFADERHLWPAFNWLIEQRQPAIVFGEQVASKDGRLWLAGVRADLEALGYAVGSADLCAAGVSAPHIRQRLYWLGESNSARRSQRRETAATLGQRGSAESASGDGVSRLSESTREPLGWGGQSRLQSDDGDPGLVNANGYHEHWWSGPLQVGRNCCEAEIERSGRKYRAQWRLKPGLSLLAHGIPGRVGQLCGFGNAIVPQVAEAFIKSYLEATNWQ